MQGFPNVLGHVNGNTMLSITAAHLAPALLHEHEVP